MIFADIPAGDSVFIDANVFVYDFGPDPVFGPPCRGLLERVEHAEVKGCISANVLHEAAHRLMTLEACQTFGWPYAGIGQRLRRHPREIQQLHRYRDALDEIVGSGVMVLSVSARDVLLAGDLSRSHGMLSGDALILAVMQSHSLVNLASSDADFDRVLGIKRFAPT
jgi:predicted nucleic acid-binding protein